MPTTSASSPIFILLELYKLVPADTLATMALASSKLAEHIRETKITQSYPYLSRDTFYHRAEQKRKKGYKHLVYPGLDYGRLFDMNLPKAQNQNQLRVNVNLKPYRIESIKEFLKISSSSIVKFVLLTEFKHPELQLALKQLLKSNNEYGINFLDELILRGHADTVAWLCKHYDLPHPAQIEPSLTSVNYITTHTMINLLLRHAFTTDSPDLIHYVLKKFKIGLDNIYENFRYVQSAKTFEFLVQYILENKPNHSINLTHTSEMLMFLASKYAHSQKVKEHLEQNHYSPEGWSNYFLEKLPEGELKIILDFLSRDENFFLRTLQSPIGFCIQGPDGPDDFTIRKSIFSSILKTPAGKHLIKLLLHNESLLWKVLDQEPERANVIYRWAIINNDPEMAAQIALSAKSQSKKFGMASWADFQQIISYWWTMYKTFTSLVVTGFNPLVNVALTLLCASIYALITPIHLGLCIKDCARLFFRGLSIVSPCSLAESEKPSLFFEGDSRRQFDNFPRILSN